MPRYELDGQVAVVTGAGRGIGRATALRLAREGASVTVADINEANAKGVAEEIESTAGNAYPFTVDVTDKTDAERMVSETVARFGKLDILVNNAGIAIIASLMDTDEATWDALMNVNAKGVLLCSQAAARQMIAQGNGGRIINNASGAGKTAPGIEAHRLVPMLPVSTLLSRLRSSSGWNCRRTGFWSTVCVLGLWTHRCGT